MLNDQNQHFALRKLSIGLASVLIGISFISAGQTAEADTVQNNASQSPIVQNDQKVKENDAVKSVQDAQIQGDALNNSAVQGKQDSNNNAQPVSKQMTAQANAQNVNARETKFDSVSQDRIVNGQRASQTTKVARVSSAQDTVDVSSTDPNAKQTNKYRIIEKLPDNTTKVLAELDLTSHRSAVRNTSTNQVAYGDWSIADAQLACPTNNSQAGDASQIFGIKVDNFANYATHIPDNYSSSEVDSLGNSILRIDNLAAGLHLDLFVNTPLGAAETYKNPVKDYDFVITYTANTQDVSATDPNAKMLNNYKVIENLPNNNPKTVWDVDIESHRSAVKNLATGQVTYGDWETQKSVITNYTNNGNPGDPSFTPGINIDQVAGYTPVASSWQSSEKNNQGAWLINYVNDQNTFTFDFQPGVSGDTPTTYKSMPANRVFYINYTANPQSIKYTFADDDDNGKEVLTKTVKGVTDQTVNTNLALPTNYVLAPNNTVPNTVKLGAVNNPVIIHVKHAVQDVTMTDPNASKKTVYRVIERMPNGQNKTVAEIDVTSRKIATKDLVTGKTTYSDNYVYDKSSINAVIRNDASKGDPTEIYDAPIDQIPGYTVSMNESLSSLQDSKGNYMLKFFSWKDGTYALDFVVGDGRGATYKNPPESQDFYINYVPTKQQVTLNYYDSDDHDRLVKSETVTGDYNSTIAITPTDTDNYYFDPDRSHSSEYHIGFTKANKPVAIYLKHKTNNTYDFDTANRDIIVNLPDGVKHEYWQKIGFRRTKTVDLVTNQTAYGDWNVFDQTSAWRIDQTWQESKPYIIKNGAVRFAPINLPKVPGYRPILIKKHPKIPAF